MTVGLGHALSHHGEILQGVFLDEGRRCRGLVTLPMTGIGARAEFTPSAGDPLTVRPTDRVKALRAATLAINECARLTGRRRCGGHLRLCGDIPVGLGMGSSTSDIIATIRAVAASFAVRLPEDAVARLAVLAEQASDPLMLDDRPLLFAQREGRVIEELGSVLPRAVVLGCLTGGGRPVDTLAVAPDAYRHDDVRTFERLRTLLRRAIADADLALLGRISTESARHNQRILPKEEFSELETIAEQTGAAGVQVAHSGNVAGLLFDPTAPDLDRRLRSCMRALKRGDILVTRLFGIGNGRTESKHGRPHRRGDRPAGPGAHRQRARLPAF